MKKLACCLMILAPVAVWAQAANPPAVAQHYDSTLEQLRDRLQLTPEQQGLWHAYEGKVDAYTGLYYREKPVLASEGDSATRQVGRLVDKLQNRLAALEDVEGAAKSLYSGLSPEQQKTANQMLLSTIPTFESTTVTSTPPMPEGKRKGEGGMRSHRSGSGMGGGSF